MHQTSIRRAPQGSWRSFMALIRGSLEMLWELLEVHKTPQAMILHTFIVFQRFQEASWRSPRHNPSALSAFQSLEEEHDYWLGLVKSGLIWYEPDPPRAPRIKDIRILKPLEIPMSRSIGPVSVLEPPGWARLWVDLGLFWYEPDPSGGPTYHRSLDIQRIGYN